MLFHLLQSSRVEVSVPADVHEHFDAAIKVQERRRCRRCGLRAEERREAEHLPDGGVFGVGCHNQGDMVNRDYGDLKGGGDGIEFRVLWPLRA